MFIPLEPLDQHAKAHCSATFPFIAPTKANRLGCTALRMAVWKPCRLAESSVSRKVHRVTEPLCSIVILSIPGGCQTSPLHIRYSFGSKPSNGRWRKRRYLSSLKPFSSKKVPNFVSGAYDYGHSKTGELHPHVESVIDHCQSIMMGPPSLLDSMTI